MHQNLGRFKAKKCFIIFSSQNYFGTFYLFAFLALIGIIFVALALPGPGNGNDCPNGQLHNKE